MQQVNFTRTAGHTIAAAAVLAAIFASVPAQAQGGNPTPFGLELGSTSCDAARAKLASKQEKKLGDSDVLVFASNPGGLYPGASSVFARCSENKVIAVQMEASKGGMGNTAAREAFTALNRKYKLVDGKPMPSMGDGYARFVAGNSVIEQSAPHLSFEYTLTFYSKGFYDLLASENQKKEQQQKQAKVSAF